jgi:phosphohistidine phosphatase
MEDALLMGRALGRLDPGLHLVVTSPLKRAVQTGELMGKAACRQAAMQSSENLAPGFHQRSLLKELLALGEGGSVLVIGHQPDMGDFLSFLVSPSGPVMVALPPAAVAKVVIPSPSSPDEAALHWLLTPELAKAIVPNP